MIRDYAGRRPSRSVRGRQKGPAAQGQGGVQKLIGTVFVVAMFVGLCFSFWVGQEIRDGLRRLSGEQQRQEELSGRQGILLQERDSLLTRERIESAAMGLGLYRPTPRQILRP